VNARRMLRLFCRATLLAIFALGLFAGSFTHYSYAHQFRELPNTAPSAAHWLGTDALGRDLFTRIVYGTRVSLLLAPAAALLATIISALLGISILRERVTIRKAVGLVSALAALAVLAKS